MVQNVMIAKVNLLLLFLVNIGWASGSVGTKFLSVLACSASPS